MSRSTRIATLLAAVSLAALTAGIARAQQANGSVQLPEVDVSAPNSGGTTPANNTGAFAVTPTYNTPTANLGPLGTQSILNTPTSVTVVPEELIDNQQAHTV